MAYTNNPFTIDDEENPFADVNSATTTSHGQHQPPYGYTASPYGLNAASAQYPSPAATPSRSANPSGAADAYVDAHAFASGQLHGGHPTAATPGSAALGNDLTDREEALRRREEELAERERQVRIQQQDLARMGVYPPNWPPFYPMVHHDISVSIPQESQPTVTRLYKLWLGTVATLAINAVAALFILLAHPDNMSTIVSDFAVAAIYVVLISALSFATWYFPAYLAFKTNSSLYSYIFLVFNGFHILFAAYMAIGIPGSGGCGLVTLIAVASDGKLLAALFTAVAFAGWATVGFVSTYLWKTVYDHTRVSGHTLENARNEAVTATARSGVAQQAAASYVRSTTGNF
ncbi:scamp family-domain-containing protein [Entophlyctis helioformis]|nr:scamp family-domain-containing protein [Entophlyctis helioformis]